MNGNSVDSRAETLFTKDMTNTVQKRQTCSVCFKTTTDYTTQRYDRRTQAEIVAGRPPQIGVFHACRTCRPGAKDSRQLACHTCGGSGQVRASWGEPYHCLTCSCSGKVWVDDDRCTGERYMLNPDAPEEGTDVNSFQLPGRTLR